MRKRLCAFVLLLLLLSARPGDAAEVPVKPKTSYKPDLTAVTAMAATKGNANAVGLDVNLSYLLTNGGIQVRSWNRTDDNDSSKVDFCGYAGVGFQNILQVQAGYSSVTRLGIRLRSDIPWTPTVDSWIRFNKGQYWTVTPLIEIPLANRQGVVFGLGLGYTF